MKPWTNIELNPTKPKINPKKPDQIRLMIASVEAEPGRVTRDVMSVLWYSTILETATAWGKFTDLYDTVPHSPSSHPIGKAQWKIFATRSTSKMKPPWQGHEDFRSKILSYIVVQFFRYESK